MKHAVPTNPPEDYPWSLYLLRCANGNYYLGISQDVQVRVDQHCRGQGARYTKIHGVERLVGWIEIGSRTEATRIEKQVKRWSQARKLKLFAQHCVK